MAGKPGMYADKQHLHRCGWKYCGVDRYAMEYFKNMHGRVRRGKVSCTDFTRDRDGYLEFCKELGPIPAKLKRVSVGRIDHFKGYVRGNIRWEEYNYNSRKRYANQDNFAKLDKLVHAAYTAAEDDIPF